MPSLTTMSPSSGKTAKLNQYHRFVFLTLYSWYISILGRESSRSVEQKTLTSQKSFRTCNPTAPDSYDLDFQLPLDSIGLAVIQILKNKALFLVLILCQSCPWQPHPHLYPLPHIPPAQSIPPPIYPAPLTL